jgi:hypothetical protein
MDCYIALDRLTQSRVFDAVRRYRAGELQVRPYDPEEEHGPGLRVCSCAGGNGPEGHEHDCPAVVGFAFG